MIKICTQCYARNNPHMGTGPRVKTNAIGLMAGLAFFLLWFFVPLPPELAQLGPLPAVVILVATIVVTVTYGRSEACSGCAATGTLVPEDSPRGRALQAEAQRHAVAVPPPAVPPPGGA